MNKIEFLEKNNKTYSFLVEGGSFEELNALRRIICYNLPIYAIDEVDFIENDSVIVDEILANRIGLCPVVTPANNSGKKVSFSLDVAGPKTVYTKELVSSDSEVKMVYDTIPLTKLKSGQNLKFEAFAILGKAKEHSKFLPSIISYRQLCELDVLRGCDGCSACKDLCPKGIITINSSSGKPVVKDNKECDGCLRCVDACEKGCLKLNFTENYILNIELVGQCSISDLIKLFSRYTEEYFKVLKKKFK
ncbi:MAG: DNA-directed RNA polymerase subunit D [archaeon]